MRTRQMDQIRVQMDGIGALASWAPPKRARALNWFHRPLIQKQGQ
jgi:hypothetical protein